MEEEEEQKEDQPQLTKEEIEMLKEKAKKTEELEGKVKELESDEQLINWRKSRERIKRLETELKKGGKNIDDEGNIIDEPKAITEEEIDKRTTVKVEQVLINKSVAKAERELPESDRAIFRKAYEKVVYGEQVDSENVEDFIAEALHLAEGKKDTSIRTSRVRGGAPVFEEKKESFADKPEGEALAKKLGLRIK